MMQVEPCELGFYDGRDDDELSLVTTTSQAVPAINGGPVATNYLRHPSACHFMFERKQKIAPTGSAHIVKHDVFYVIV